MSIRKDDLTRQELLDLVWSKPMTQLAHELGVSDTALAKICRRHHVPRPPNGYFMKREDRRVKPQELPRIADSRLEAIHIVPRAAAPSTPVPPDIQARIDAEMKRDRAIKVSAKLTRPHPLVEATRKHLDKQKPYPDSPRVRSVGPYLCVHVAPASVARAMRILDALLKAAEARGHAIKIEEQSGKYVTFMEIDGETIPFKLIEKTTRHERAAAEEDEHAESQSWYFSTRYSYSATGRLSLEIDAYSRASVRRHWQDNARHRVEECLNDFFVSALRLSAEAKANRAQRERDQREYARLVQERAERQRRLEAEQERLDELLKQVDAWHLARRIRSFVRAVRGRRGGTEEWARWALDHADRIDPCTPSPPSTRKEGD